MNRQLVLYIKTGLREKRRHIARLIIYSLLANALTIIFVSVPQTKTTSSPGESFENNTIPQDDLADYFPGELVNPIYYSPQTELTENLMETVRHRLAIVDERVVPFRSDAEMEFALLNNPSLCFGVNFQNISFEDGRLRFVIRTKNNNFRTEAVYSQDVFSSYQKRDNEYVESGFLALQNAVDQSFVSMLAEERKQNNKQRIMVAYGHIPVDDKGGPQTPAQTIHLVTVLGVVFVLMDIFALLLPMVEERANGMREHLKIASAESYWKEMALFILNFIQFSVVLLMCFTTAVVSGYWKATVSMIVYLVILSMSFVANLITFTFFLSITMESSTVATASAPIIFFGPYFLSMFSTKLVQLFCLFPTVGLCYAGLIFDVFKSSGHLFQAHNLFTASYPGLAYVSLFAVLVQQLLGTILWLFLWFYVSNVFPGRYGIPKSKGFFLSNNYWKPLFDVVKSKPRNTNKITAESQHDLQQHSSESIGGEHNFETISMEYIDQGPDPFAMEIDTIQPLKETIDADSKRVVYISKLNKVFEGRTGAKVVVKDFSLSIYSSSLTVLLGHNGAGKTTTMNIITGMLPSTSGTVVVDGEHDPNRYRSRIGFCPQHNVFFSFLNCREHLEFFGCLRGLTNAEARNEARVVLEKVNLLDKSESLVNTLSGGMKRRLSLGNAIIGHTKLLILDEPTSGLDPESRRDIWDVLLKLRQSHTILLTTHFMEEAELLADWVAIMEDGEMVTFGSPLYLKQQHGSGYTLKLFKASGFNENDTLVLIKQHIPNATIRESVKEIFAVTLPYNDAEKYAAMLKQLEMEKETLGIETIGIANTTLEEVFLNSSTRKKEFQHHPESVDCVDSPPADRLKSELTSIKTQCKTTPLHAKNVCLAIWRKKWIHMKSIKHVYVSLLLLPPLVTILCFMFTSGTIDAAKALPAVTLDANAIHQAIGVLVINRAPDSDGNGAFGNLENVQSELDRSLINGVRVVMLENVSLLASLRQRITDDYTGYRDRVVVGIECNVKHEAVEATVLYNNNLVHSTGIAESVFTTLMLRFYVGLSGATAETINIPSTRKQLIDIKTPLYFTELIAIATMFYMLIYLSEPLHEHLTGFRQLQNINRYVYWFGTYSFDLLVHTLECALVTTLVYWMDHTEAFSASSKIDIFFILWLYGVLALLVIYIISQCVENSNTAITIMSYLMIVGVFGDLILSNGYDDTEKNSPWIIMLHLVPEFGLKHSMRVVYEYQKLIMYQQLSIQQNRQKDIAFADKREHPAIFYTTASFLFGALAFSLNEVVENMYVRERIKKGGETAGQNIRRAYLKVNRSLAREDRQHSGDDGRDEIDCSPTSSDDVDQQTKLVHNLIETKAGIDQYAIIVKSLKKTYSNNAAVKSVSFAVKKGECFGLLGMNGAGKTSVFQMLSRNLPTSEGEIYLQHCEVHQANALEYRHQYGYCPQFDALLHFMTVYEVIDYFAQLKGITARERHITSWLVRLDILQYKDHTLDECSGGTKRKVNTILALLGGPSVVLLDEPTTGVDPKSRQFLWKTIKAIQRQNQTILLTSHSMDECEELCNRLSIMARGLLQCVGTIPELRQRHGQGYNLWLKLNTTAFEVDSGNVSNDIASLIAEVQERCKATLQEEHKGLLKFVVTRELPLYKLVDYVIELKAKRGEQIIAYSIYESSLEDVFLKFRTDKPKAHLENA